MSEPRTWLDRVLQLDDWTPPTDSPGAVLVGALHLLAHGVMKVTLVVALLLDKVLAYPWMIILLAIFIGYQLYRIALSPSAGLIALTVFNVVIVALIWREYGQQRQQHATVEGLGSSPDGTSTSESSRG